MVFHTIDTRITTMSLLAKIRLHPDAPQLSCSTNLPPPRHPRRHPHPRLALPRRSLPLFSLQNPKLGKTQALASHAYGDVQGDVQGVGTSWDMRKVMGEEWGVELWDMTAL